ncbi:MAG: hypothetical protein RIQ41_423 [Candidatus Parcubacteria bacterium]|jgi:hypothetical protein
MPKHLEFKAPVQTSDTSEFMPSQRLPEHLAVFANLSKEARGTMDPAIRRLLELTDITALRSAALPHNG